MKVSIPAIAALALIAGAATAQEIRPEVKARQGQFQTLSINLGILGGMARGDVAYDAARAEAAARSIAGVSMVDIAALFPEGTDAMSIEGTRAEPAIWDNLPDVLTKWQALGAGAAAMQAAAAKGPQDIGAALGGLAGACKACHDAYRTPN
ncbi:MAG: cytochrome c [Gemmobacter sp.]|jgi:cytochrome c556